MMIVTLLTFSLICDASAHKRMNNETNLFNTIFSHYDTMMSPHNGEGKPISIISSFHVENILNVDENKHTFHTIVRHKLHWTDSRLTWEPADHKNIMSINVPPEKIWKADLMFENSVGESPYLIDMDKSSPVTISCLGEINWYPSHQIETICQIDTALFPFDTQTCHFLLTTWIQDNKHIVLRTEKHAFLNSTPDASDWYIIGQESEDTDQFAASFKFSYSSVHYTIHIRRRMTFYNLSLIIPCIIHILLPLLMFHLPADNGDRMAIGTTVWASQIVFWLLITGFTPVSSVKMSLLKIVSLCALQFISFSLALTVLNTKCVILDNRVACVINLLLYLNNKLNWKSQSDKKITKLAAYEISKVKCKNVSEDFTFTNANLKSICDLMCFVMQIIALILMVIFLMFYYI